jgi:hypothetical protein
LSIDRKAGMEHGSENVKLTEKWIKLEPVIVVGLDISGDPNYGNYSWIITLMEIARNHRIPISCHLSEVSVNILSDNCKSISLKLKINTGNNAKGDQSGRDGKVYEVSTRSSWSRSIFTSYKWGKCYAMESCQNSKRPYRFFKNYYLIGYILRF